MAKHTEADSRQSLLLTILFTILTFIFWGFILGLIFQGPLRSWGSQALPTVDVLQNDNPGSTTIWKAATPQLAIDKPDDLQDIVLQTIKQYNYPLFFYPVSQDTRLPMDYPTAEAQLPLVKIGEVNVAEIMKDPLNHLLADAKEAGFSPYLRSGFRSIDDQYTAYSRYVTEATASGKDLTEARMYARQFSAEPGHSEHHLGLAVDLLDYFYPDWIIARNNYDNGLYQWLQKHSHEYGFVISYPTGTNPTYAKPGSGYTLSEPWHLRFVGDGLAEWLYRAGYLDPHMDVSVNESLCEAYLLAGNSLPTQ